MDFAAYNAGLKDRLLRLLELKEGLTQENGCVQVNQTTLRFKISESSKRLTVYIEGDPTVGFRGSRHTVVKESQLPRLLELIGVRVRRHENDREEHRSRQRVHNNIEAIRHGHEQRLAVQLGELGFQATVQTTPDGRLVGLHFYEEAAQSLFEFLSSHPPGEMG